MRDGLTVAHNDAEPCKWRKRARERDIAQQRKLYYTILFATVNGPRVQLGDFHSPPINIRLRQLLQHHEPNTRTENVWYMVPRHNGANTVIYLHPIRLRTITANNDGQTVATNTALNKQQLLNGAHAEFEDKLVQAIVSHFVAPKGPQGVSRGER